MGIAQRKRGFGGKQKTSDRLRASRGVSTDKRGAEFKAVRADILERDNYTCQRCGKSNHPSCPTSVVLTVHHKVPVAQGGRNVPSNLITLCNYCHADVPGKINRKGAAGLKSLGSRGKLKLGVLREDC